MDKANFEKVMLLDREMTKVEASLKVDAIESLMHGVRRREDQKDQTKSFMTENFTSKDPHRRKRLDYNTVRGKSLLLTLEEKVEVDMMRG